jgi:hypothetical protein
VEIRHGAAMLLATIACASRPAPEHPRAVVTEEIFVQVVEPKERSSMPPPEPAFDDDAMFACASAADCVVLEMGCCDHCNGGWLLSVNRMHAEQAVQAHRAQDCSASACETHRCEGRAQAICDAGACARLEERSLGGAAAEITVIHNSFAPR